MEVSSSHQVNVFFLYVLAGFSCGIFFDIQRVLRKMLAADVARTFIEDLLFALFTVFMAIAPGFIYNNGEMRYYQIVGILCGGIVYAVILSSVIKKILYFIFCFMHKILVVPLIKTVCFLVLPLKKLKDKINNIKTCMVRIKNRFLRHVRRKRKTIKKRIKML